MSLRWTRLARVMGLGVLSLQLSGCLIAAVPLMMAAGAATVAVAGFAVYKTVQTTSGGTVRIGFGASDTKHPLPPKPLPPPTGMVAVLGTGTREAKFATDLRASARFRLVRDDPGVLAPSSVSGPEYDAMCRRDRVDMVFAAIDLGQMVQSNLLSFSRGGVTQKLSLTAYGCAARQVVWSDTMAVVIEAGGKPTQQAEIDVIAGQAWAERIVQAKAAG